MRECSTLEHPPNVSDESPRFDALVEWWFVQGCYAEAGRPEAGRRHFMASLLRHRASGLDRPADAFSLLFSQLDEQTGATASVSQVDRTSLDLFIASGRKAARGLDARVVDAYLSEVGTYGPPRPIRTVESPPVLQARPFAAEWDGFRLASLPAGFELSLREPALHRVCCFELEAQAPPTRVTNVVPASAPTMEYVTYPALRLHGRVDDRPVEGTAWLDHQWGGTDWFLSEASGRRLLGWTWFGISLDDGARLLVMIRRDCKRGRVIARWAVLMRPGQSPLTCRTFTAVPARWWESDATRVRYPIAWRLSIPRVRAELWFDPLKDDQEIPVLGFARAIWEGAGSIRGTIGGRRVSGTARLELHGYGYLFDLSRRLKTLSKMIDRRVAEYLPRAIGETQLRKYVGVPNWKHQEGAYTAVLSRPIWDLMDRGGKHWRPMFGLLLLEALGVPSRPYEQLVSVLSELSHTGALIIDDIEDHALRRRGDTCIHLRYGVDVAINAANTAYFLPYLLLEQHPQLTDPQRLELYRILSGQSVRSHLGQGADIYFSRHLTGSRLRTWVNDSLGPKILQNYAYKTGSLIQGLAEAACVVANADAPTREACSTFARQFGVAFQIADDVLDFDGPATTRKGQGTDIAQGKVTYVILRALQQLPPAARRRLQTVLCSPALRGDRSIVKEAVGLIRGSGAIEHCRHEALEMMNSGWNRLGTVLPPSEPKVLLQAVCTRLLSHGAQVEGCGRDA